MAVILAPGVVAARVIHLSAPLPRRRPATLTPDFSGVTDLVNGARLSSGLDPVTAEALGYIDADEALVMARESAHLSADQVAALDAWQYGGIAGVHQLTAQQERQHARTNDLDAALDHWARTGETN